MTSPRSPTPSQPVTGAPQARPLVSSPLVQAFATLLGWLQTLRASLTHVQAPALLLARWHVAAVFFRSGLTKLQDWDTTLLLFREEYQVPLLSPDLAAVAGTAGELVLPVLLVLGLGGRFAALGLSVMNVVAVLSLPDIPEPALQLHVFWGTLLMGLVIWGPGRWSADAWWWPRALARFNPGA